MIQLRSFHVSDLLLFEPRDPHDMESLIKHAVRLEGPAYTAIKDGKVVGAAGVALLWPGVGEAWTVFGKDICRCQVFLNRTVKRVIEASIRALNLHRLHTMVRADSNRDINWIEYLGFKYEGIKRGYGPGQEDFLEYVMLTRR